MYVILNQRSTAAPEGGTASVRETILPGVADYIGNYTWRECCGGWIRNYMEFVENRIISELDQPQIGSSAFYRSVSDDSFNRIPDEQARLVMVRFTNLYYRRWVSEGVRYTPYEAASADVRNRRVCDGCATGWSEPPRGARWAPQFICQQNCPLYDTHLKDYIQASLTTDRVMLTNFWLEFRHVAEGGSLPTHRPTWLNPERTANEVRLSIFDGIAERPHTEVQPNLDVLLSQLED